MSNCAPLIVRLRVISSKITKLGTVSSTYLLTSLSCRRSDHQEPRQACAQSSGDVGNLPLSHLAADQPIDLGRLEAVPFLQRLGDTLDRGPVTLQQDAGHGPSAFEAKLSEREQLEERWQSAAKYVLRAVEERPWIFFARSAVYAAVHKIDRAVPPAPDVKKPDTWRERRRTRHAKESAG